MDQQPPVKRKPPKRVKQTPEERNAARRTRFLDRQVRYVKHARRALARVQKIGNPTHYDYSPDEGKAILAALDKSMAEVRRAFEGSPKEKGLFDL